MKNTANLKFKRGTYFLWFGDLFRIISTDQETYNANPVHGETPVHWVFGIDDEDEMTHVSKKKNPEYFL